jgi:hypothetical protein
MDEVIRSADLRPAGWVVRNVVPRIRPPVCCVKPRVAGTLRYMQPALHAKVSRNKHPQKARIGGFGAKTYASNSFLRVLTVYFPRAAAATPNWVTNLAQGQAANLVRSVIKSTEHR